MKLLRFVTNSLILLILFSGISNAQSIKGQILNQESNDPEVGLVIKIENTGFSTVTNFDGVFKFYDLPEGTYVLSYEDNNQSQMLTEVIYNGTLVDLGALDIRFTSEEEVISDDSNNSDITIISLADNELIIDESLEAAGILSASQDPFLRTAAFAWGAARFNARGLQSEQTFTTINGVKMNESFNGRVFFGQWGGMNDFFRNVHTSYGLGASEYGIGYLLGTVDFDIRAGSQRAQTRVSYANSNRSYDHRIMISHSTGFNQKGWAFSIGGSRRWAEEGYITGTFYDSWSAFIGVEKQLNDKHNIYFNAFNNVSRRGKAGALLLEVAEIVGDDYHNPYWGWQSGEKRNSRIGSNNQPIFMLGNDVEISDKLELHNVVSYQFGRNGNSALQWLDAPNPAADFHRKLVTRIENEAARESAVQTIMENPDFYQIDWDFIYFANTDNIRTVENANGTPGNTITGNFARYIIEDRIDDTKELNFNSRFNYTISDNNLLIGGITYSGYNGRHFTEVEDLLGADYYLDVDRFADPIARPGTDQRDLNNTNAIKQEGDVFGYDYDSNIHQVAFWAQEQLNFKNLNVFFGGELSNTRMWRTGNMRNGYFPEESFGDSEKQSFTNYRAKMGLSYRLGRNQLFGRFYQGTRAPYFRNAFIAPRLNNFYVPLLENVNERSAEIGYGYKSPRIDIRARGYYIDSDNDSEVFFFYSEEDFIFEGENRNGAFGSFVNHNIDKRHVGVELIGQVKLNSTLTAKATAALGQHLYDTRWRQWAFGDIFGYFRNDLEIYNNNFYVETTPQTAYNLELKYDSPNYWFATLNFNYLSNRYLDFSTDRRIEAATINLEEGSAEFNDVILQERLDPAFTIDLFFHKSFKLSNGNFILLTAAVNNILSDDFFSGGYEQLRYDSERGPDWFNTRYFRAYGINYFVGLTYRI